MRILCLRDHPLANWLDYSALFISAPGACAPQCVSTVPHQGLFLTSIVDDLRNGRGASRIPHPQAPVPRVPDLLLQTTQSNPSHTRAGAYLRGPAACAQSASQGTRRQQGSRRPTKRPAGKIPRPIRKQRTPWLWMLRRCHRRDRSVLLFITIE